MKKVSILIILALSFTQINLAEIGNLVAVGKKIQSFQSKAYCNPETLWHTYELSKYCIDENIPGDFVECGVAAGAQIAVMAYTCEQLKSDKKVHLLDSFEGIPLAGPNDDAQPGIGKITHNTNVKNLDDLLVSSGVSAWNIDRVNANMREWNIDSHRLIYHKGWFQHVLPKVHHLIDKICLLRLDGDLYESTKVCLEYLYPKVSKGGWVIIDDYHLTGCHKAVHEYLAKHNITVEIKEVDGLTGTYTFANPVYWQVQ